MLSYSGNANDSRITNHDSNTQAILGGSNLFAVKLGAAVQNAGNRVINQNGGIS